MNAYEVQSLAGMGINPARLGCVMLDVEPLPVAGVIPDQWLYTSTDPDLHWVNGVEVQSHITLLYGLLFNAHTIRDAVDEVLAGWRPGTPFLADTRVFGSPQPVAEPYACIVGSVSKAPWLVDAHARLSLLPHVDTHPEYLPHVTIAYVQAQHAAAAVRELAYAGVGSAALKPIGLNYGRPPADGSVTG